MVYISFLCLSIVILSCILGMLWPGFKDNLLQNVGMGGICWWAGMRIDRLLDTGNISWTQLVLHVSLAVYFLGTFYKVYQFHRASGHLFRNKLRT